MAATSSPGGRGSRAGIVGINVTPMVDVVLVLLVIMMVSANYIVSQSMQVDLPKAANGDGGVSSVAVVSVQADGALRWNGDPIDEAGLSAALRKAAAEDPETNLVLSADSAAAHGKVVRVMDLAREEGITQFAIGVEQAP
jgi:biopolymer transport protein ExbD